MKVKRILDVVMFILLLFLMAFFNTGQTVHEVLGILMAICFIIHHVLNRNWYKTVFKGKYPLLKKVYIVVNFLLLVDVVFLVLSGLSMSRLLPFLSFMPVSLARRVHLTLSYWGFVLMAVHFGLHIQSISRPLAKKFEDSSKVVKTIIFLVIPYGLTLFGLIMFIKNQLIAYLFMLTDFVNVDSSINLVRYIFEYLGIFSLLGLFTYIVIKNIKKS